VKSSAQIRRQAKSLYELCLVEGMLDDSRALQVVQAVIASERRGSFALLAHFQRLVRLDRQLHTAIVESAVPLPEDFKISLRTRLTDLYGPAIATQFAITPGLIGGMRIRVGSDVYDGSVRSELESLRNSF
jgi:F-type H+-transporting ATPase subunit delta